MILKKLNLIGFGKFKNKNIELKEGINLIYGENEAGKSTIHSFIQGMFYGFLKPNARTRAYLEEHERYNPWDRTRYAGVLTFKYNGKSYRIERDFTKGQEKTRVFDEITGEDITNKIDNGPSRVLQPGIHFFGFSSRVFSNTISIKQLGSKTEKDLAQEVIDKLINVSQSLDDDISVDKAISELRNRMAEIGTERAPTKPYARNLKVIEELFEERERILLEKDKYEFYLEEKDRLINDLLEDENYLKDLQDKLRRLEIYEKAKMLEESKKIQADIEILEKEIDELSIYSQISKDDYKEAISLCKSIEYFEKDIRDSDAKLKEAEAKLKSLEDNLRDNKIRNFDETIEDYNLYEELDDEKNSIVYNKADNSLEFLKRDYSEHKKDISKFNAFQLICLVLTIISFGIAFFVPSIRYHIILLATAFILIWLYLKTKIKKLNLLIDNINNQIIESEKKERERKDRLEEIDRIQNEILSKYNLKSKIEFKRLHDKLQLEYLGREESILLYDELSKAKKSLIERLDNLKVELERNSKRLSDILKENNVNNIDEFSIALDKKAQYEKDIREMEAKEELLNKILGHKSIDSLLLELENEKIIENLGEMDKEQLVTEIDKCNERISNYKLSLTRVEENINILTKDISRLVEIEEELERRVELKKNLENEYRALDLAINTIESISKEIHDEFAPDINNKVSNLIEKITKGKYNKIRVDENLNIRVENPNTKELIDISNLSGGTIDQLYFSLRFSLINSMVENNYPLILDDCFIQYDNYRLENILDFIVTISQNRQIIMFTCHNREKEILDDMGVDYNYISLT